MRDQNFPGRQWLRCHTSSAGVQAQSLVKELRCYKLHSQKKKKKILFFFFKEKAKINYFFKIK